MNFSRRRAWVAAPIALALAAWAVPLVPGTVTRAADKPADKPAAAMATFEVYKDKAGEHRWRLRAANRNVIATSGDGYKDKRDCLAAIESVKRHAADAKVTEDAKATEEAK